MSSQAVALEQFQSTADRCVPLSASVDSTQMIQRVEETHVWPCETDAVEAPNLRCIKKTRCLRVDTPAHTQGFRINGTPCQVVDFIIPVI